MATKIEEGTKVKIIAVPSEMYQFLMGKEAKAGAHCGEVSGRRQFLFDGTKAVYLDDSQVEIL